MFRVFGLTGAFVLVGVAAGVVVDFAGVSGDVDAGAVFDAGATAFGAALPALLLMLPFAGVVDDVGVVGNVVIGVGTGGKGFASTLAISSFRPASDWL